MSLGFLHFLSPTWLLALGVLPVFWWLLRSVPPLPRRIRFPAIDLLRGLVPDAQLTARTPWWLLLLRLAIVAGVIMYLAQPVMGVLPTTRHHGDLLLIIDNDWAAARDWSERTKILHAIVTSARRDDRRVIVLPTAGMGAEILPIPLDARDAEQKLGVLQPQPWAADWAQAITRVRALRSTDTIGQVLWLSSGVGGHDAVALYEQLEVWPEVEVIGTSTPLTLIRAVTEEHGSIDVQVEGSALGDVPTEAVAMNERGGILAHAPVTQRGQGTGQAVLTLPPDLRHEVSRITVGRVTAANSWVFDSRWRKKSVALIGDASVVRHISYLDPVTYLHRALQPVAEVHLGTVADAIAAQPSLIVVSDSAVAESALRDLRAWVEAGGTLLRFADEGDVANQGTWRDLSPVMLRTEQRALGGTLSWDKPERLRPFAETSPFSGLVIPDDVVVHRQWLAEPDSVTDRTVWAQLQDGTPLITATTLGRGRSILVHVPARPGWSNLPVSGLFVEMLRRVLDLSAVSGASIKQVQSAASLSPLAVMDGFGRLHAVQGETDKAGMMATLQPLSMAEGHAWVPSPQNPPGLYGNSVQSYAFNLGAALPPLALLADRRDVHTYADATESHDLGGMVLAIILVLLCCDTAVSLYLRGLLTLRGRWWGTAGAVVVIVAVVGCGAAVQAKDTKRVEDDLSATTHLGYVRTGDAAVDRVSEAGLRTLARVIAQRTLIQPLEVRAVDVERDDLVFYPFLYWPLTDHGRPISEAAAARVNSYLRNQGMILFDNIGDTPLPIVRQQKLAGIDMPVLMPLPPEHVVRRSFYLLDQVVGRHNHPDFWVSSEAASSGDAVASVLLGRNDFAGAWAADAEGRFMYACEPDGTTQRDLAFRFGVNVVMYALTGNYKADQVHAATILQRLEK